MTAVDYSTLKKGGFMRQKQKGFFSLRLGIVGGQVTSEQLNAVMKVADTYGKGYIHLTSRQGIEIPFINIKDIEEVKAALAEGGIAPGVCEPRVRTVTACQGNKVCPNACIDTEEMAQELSTRYFGRELPHKFKLGVTGCQNNCLKAEENDLGIKGGLAVKWIEERCISCGVCEKTCRNGAIKISDGKINITYDKCNNCGRCAFTCPVDAYETAEGYFVYFGGLFGNTINKGTPLVPFITNRETVLKICDAAINFFKENAKSGERFKFTIDRVGEEALRKKIMEAYNDGQRN